MGTSSRRGFTLIELMIVVTVIGLLAAIAIPNFLHYQTRAKQSEVRANLKSLSTAERAFYLEKGRYTPFVKELSWLPERGNRYTYYLSDGSQGGNAIMPRKTKDENWNTPAAPKYIGIAVDQFKYPSLEPVLLQPVTGGPASVKGACPNCEWVGAAVGNLDSDPGLDVWSIATFTRTGVAIGAVPGGEAACEADDMHVSNAPLPPSG